jgi:hypothetical protein
MVANRDAGWFDNFTEHRVTIRPVDGPSVVLGPGETARLWLHGGVFYRRRPSWWWRAWVRWRGRGSWRP